MATAAERKEIRGNGKVWMRKRGRRRYRVSPRLSSSSHQEDSLAKCFLLSLNFSSSAISFSHFAAAAAISSGDLRYDYVPAVRPTTTTKDPKSQMLSLAKFMSRNSLGSANLSKMVPAHLMRRE